MNLSLSLSFALPHPSKGTGWARYLPCCWRARGVQRLEKAALQRQRQHRLRWAADAAAVDSIRLQVSALSGDPFDVCVTRRTTGEELRARVAEMTSFPVWEVVGKSFRKLCSAANSERQRKSCNTRKSRKGGLAKMVSTAFSVAPKKTKTTQGSWTWQCIWHSERDSQERRTFLRKPPSKIPLVLGPDNSRESTGDFSGIF